ncbi:methylated-DNA/protein-cysteinemethyltransferase [Kribbella flavida DSM 17836]|uniref:Methylated-DNA--protein-cysteine methyltransferase n=1 Tax=Kribbella flavida (strain DSM 17836 / JCM 10339 / NBRC 14399) TaxID=479435 RepID=D2PRD9_KRIFD|nr:methylated-DNA--[protein]-cysteine S-methyltransferase [Kribbella flavida]ADB34857.1 methylated-DNA/protein-cysteinemethyltransferase [Kribbella flavida DSM 17836]
MPYAVIGSPIGDLTLVGSDEGELMGIYMEQHRHRPPMETFGPRDDTILPEVVRQLTEYFDGTRTTFDVPLKLVGTPFQREVWTALTEIPYGTTTTYGELADVLGKTAAASRAVGLANGKNPISIIVPCHRVVASTGHLTGYAGGLSRKQALLSLERADALF